MLKKRVRRNGRPIAHEQWIEITREDGKTVSTFYPPNDEFEKLMLEMDPKPDLIYRRLNFVNGVPSEYNWVDPTDDFRRYGGLFLQRVLPSDWPYLKAVESIQREHHVVSALNPQPRPPPGVLAHAPAAPKSEKPENPPATAQPPRSSLNERQVGTDTFIRHRRLRLRYPASG